jgi:hypothetical protein
MARAPFHVGLVFGLRADARNSQGDLQVFDEAIAILFEVLGERIHRELSWPVGAVGTAGHGTTAGAANRRAASRALERPRSICEDAKSTIRGPTNHDRPHST